MLSIYAAAVIINMVLLLQVTAIKNSLIQPDDTSDMEQRLHNIKQNFNNDIISENLRLNKNHRHHKMLNYYGYYPTQMLPSATPSPLLYPFEYLNNFPNFEEEEKEEDNYEISPRAAIRRPSHSGRTENSPVYYIKLPPTPYMFVPGMGYMSQPPAFTQLQSPPMTPIQSPLAPINVNPFLNLPLNFISNGRPSNIYQFGGNGMQSSFPTSQYYSQQTVQMPFYKPARPYRKDSKITNLKGNFGFNGRPEEIYILPNDYNPLYSSESHSYY